MPRRPVAGIGAMTDPALSVADVYHIRFTPLAMSGIEEESLQYMTVFASGGVTTSGVMITDRVGDSHPAAFLVLIK
tara:strand:+ start:335 stop:562 length:228 start_codon:yes stop_codon:yes gene_type:complete